MVRRSGHVGSRKAAGRRPAVAIGRMLEAEHAATTSADGMAVRVVRTGAGTDGPARC